VKPHAHMLTKCTGYSEQPNTCTCLLFVILYNAYLLLESFYSQLSSNLFNVAVQLSETVAAVLAQITELFSCNKLLLKYKKFTVRCYIS